MDTRSNAVLGTANKIAIYIYIYICVCVCVCLCFCVYCSRRHFHFNTASISFLCPFAKLRRVTIGFVMPVSARLSVHTEQLGSHWTDFHLGFISEYFSKICRENSSFVTIWQNNGTVHEDQCTFLIIYRCILFRGRIVSGKFVETTETHILCSVTFFFRKTCPLWDHVAKIQYSL